MFRLLLLLLLLLATPAKAQLLQQEHIELLGTFRMPSGSHLCGNFTDVTNNFSYGGTALAHNPATNTLYIVGHDWRQCVAEISIPTPSLATTYSQLPQATVIQPFKEVTEGGMFGVDNGTIKVGGLLVHGGQLYITAYSYYDADGSQQLSHFRRPLNLSTTGQVAGPFQVGALGAGFVSGYMAHVPTALQATLGGPVVTGNCCLPIITRTSFGPAIFSFNPANFGPANALVYYNTAHPTLGNWNQQSDYFNGTTQIKGAVIPEGAKTALFIGRHGIGPFCYGTGAACQDPAISSQGNHAYPYKFQWWAYKTDDLAAVKAGTKQPWEVIPYGIWRPTLPFSDASATTGGVAYDPATQRVYVARMNCNTSGSVCIDVWKINPPPPPAPDVIVECGPTVTCTFQRTGPSAVAITAPNGVGIQINGEWMQ